MDNKQRALNGLRVAAEAIGINNYRKMGKKYHVTPTHKHVIDTMGELIEGKITPDMAMAVVHEYDVRKERYNG